MTFIRAVITFFIPLIMVVVVVWFAVFDPIFARRDAAVSGIQTTLEEYNELSNNIAVIASAAQSTAIPKGFVWPLDGNKSSELVIQRAILELAKSADLELARFGPGRAPDVNWSSVVSQNIELTGSLESLVRFLSDIEQSQPRLAISSIRIRNRALHEQVEGTTQISANVSIWALSEVGQ